jgi:hypothetical protein
MGGLEDTIKDSDAPEVIDVETRSRKPRLTDAMCMIDDEFRRILGSYSAEDLEEIFKRLPAQDAVCLLAVDRPFLYRLNGKLPPRIVVRKKIHEALAHPYDVQGTVVYRARLAFITKTRELESKGKVTGYPHQQSVMEPFEGAFPRDAKEAETINRVFESERKELESWMKHFESLWKNPGITGSMPYE